jgi:heat shock protein HtpX
LIVLAIVVSLLAPLISTLIQLAISRKREFLADASGVLLTRYPEGLARALEKIAADTERLEVANRGTAHLYIANPLKDRSGKSSVGWLASLFSTHPPVEERIKILRKLA